MKERIWISCPDLVHNNYGIQIYCNDKNVVRSFIEQCWQDFPKEMYQPFLQGSQTDWAYFEFFTEISNELQLDLFERATKIAHSLGLPLDIEDS